jgi:hypothetical protein
MIQVVVLLSVMKAYVQIQMFIAALSVIKSQTEKKSPSTGELQFTQSNIIEYSSVVNKNDY